MIGRLAGTIAEIDGDRVIVDCHGVGYLAHCSKRTLGRIGGTGVAAVLTVETVVREDAITLYGFADRGERDWFRLLTTVQGVGARVALAILSVLEPDRLTAAIVTQDKTALSRADGVGPKLAARIVNELKDKVSDLAITPSLPAAAIGVVAEAEGGSAVADAVSALVNLGYRRPEALTAVAAAARDLGDGVDVGTLIRRGLKELAP
ncbi:MAG TPA: Holliday junction branch migration protein RuvA [Alphaproteobacteria bacterium]|nr:Holliday junction branch migration protein RuvA [Alphaproteobacteria bacterium]